MAHFAEIDVNNLVTRVLAIDQENVDTGRWGTPSTWIKTSYNTRGGKHYGQDGLEDSGVALRKNYAGEGYTYDEIRDAFISPKPYTSWTLDDATCQWEAPVVYPSDDKIYTWNETDGAWDAVPE